jgi:hypothetical protein
MNKRLPLGLLAILLIVLLAGVGVAYGLWSETLHISGWVMTGTVDVEFKDIKVTEKVGTPDGVVDEPEEKANAANCYAVMAQVSTGSPETLAITVIGAYPSYHCYVTFKVNSTGSVPVHIYQPEVVPNHNNYDWVSFEDCYENDTQLHKDESGTCTLLIHFTNDDNVSENTSYTFLYQIEARQWNEPRPTDNTP